MTGNATVDFMILMDEIGEELDSSDVAVPEDDSKESWVVARALQSIAHVHAKSAHRVISVTVQTPEGELFSELEDYWPTECPTLGLNHHEDSYNDPLLDGSYRLWLEILEDPESALYEDARDIPPLTDLMHVHGIAPDETQSARIRELNGTSKVLALSRTRDLEQALQEAETQA